MADSKDYYSILGISKTATPDEVKRAYRKLALQHHPDRNKGDKTAEAKFKEVTKAYEVLSDSKKREMYDQVGHAAFEGGAGQAGGFNPFGGGFGQQGGNYGPFTYTYSTSGGQGGGPFAGGGFSDPFDIFEQFFGGASPFGQQARRPVYSLTISFDEAVHGGEKTVTIDNKKEKIKIPAGVDSGSRIRFKDYDIVMDVMPDKVFHRQGYDIVTEHEISFAQAVLGMELMVETINGPVKIRVPQGTQPNTLIRLRSKGVPHVRGSGKGDHYVKIKILIPKQVTHRQKELLEEFDKESGKKGWF